MSLTLHSSAVYFFQQHRYIFTISGLISQKRRHLCWCQRPRRTTGSAQGKKQKDIRSHLHLCHHGRCYQCPVLHPQPIWESHNNDQYGSGQCTTMPSIKTGEPEKILLNQYWPWLKQYIKPWKLYCCSPLSLIISFMSLFSECPPLRLSTQQAMESHNHLNTFLLHL